MRAACGVGALALALLVGCRTPPPGPTVELAPDDPRVSTLLEGHAKRAAARDSLRATAVFSVDAEDFRARGSQRLALRRPADLRVELLGLFSQLVAVLVTDGQSYALYEAGEPRVERGRVFRGLLWDVARVDLEPRQAVDLLLGVPQPARGLRVSGARREQAGGLRIEFGSSPGRRHQKIAFDAAGRLRSFESRGVPGQADVEASFSDYRDVAGVQFAFDIDLHFPRRAARAEFRFRSVELGPALPDDLFVLRIPERVPSGAGGSHE